MDTGDDLRLRVSRLNLTPQFLSAAEKGLVYQDGVEWLLWLNRTRSYCNSTVPFGLVVSHSLCIANLR
jgi:hypothetical protein